MKNRERYFLSLLFGVGVCVSSVTTANADDRCGHDRWDHRRPSNSVTIYRPYSGPYVYNGTRRGELLSSEQIREGARRGELSRDEARRLESERRDIIAEMNRYRSDGYVDRHERADLREDIKDYKKDLRHQLHDDEYGW